MHIHIKRPLMHPGRKGRIQALGEALGYDKLVRYV
jgi:hypothetical protein